MKKNKTDNNIVERTEWNKKKWWNQCLFSITFMRLSVSSTCLSSIENVWCMFLTVVPIELVRMKSEKHFSQNYTSNQTENVNMNSDLSLIVNTFLFESFFRWIDFSDFWNYILWFDSIRKFSILCKDFGRTVFHSHPFNSVSFSFSLYLFTLKSHMVHKKCT